MKLTLNRAVNPREIVVESSVNPRELDVESSVNPREIDLILGVLEKKSCYSDCV